MNNGHIELADLDRVDSLVARGDYHAIVKFLSGSYATDMWAAAMTAHFGPSGIHKSWCNADGTPSAMCLEKCPDVGERMATARVRVTSLRAWYRRRLADA